jgi:hypothetical protein
MSSEVAIISGLGIISGLFAYFAFETRNSDDGTFGSNVSLFFFFVSFLFLNLLMYAVLLIGQNNATYLTSGVLVTGLQIMTYSSVGLLIIYMIYVLITFVMAMNDWVKEALGKRTKQE